METQSRALLKTMSWRVIATLITTLIAWGFTGSGKLGISIGLTEAFIKMFAYYSHERMWTKVAIGYVKPESASEAK